MKVLVTGGAGFIGSHLVDGLLAAGHSVRVLDNLDPQVHGSTVPASLNPDAEFIRGDVRDVAVVDAALDNIDAVYHEAAAVGVGQSMYQIAHYVSVNSLGAAVMLEAIVARRDVIAKVVVASSMSIYGEGLYRDSHGSYFAPVPRPEAQLADHRWEILDSAGNEAVPVPTNEAKPLNPTSVYAVTKRDHEELFLSTGVAYSIPTVALRYFNVFGPRQALSNPYTGVAAIFSSRLLAGARPVVYEDGNQTRDFVHVSDIVQANLKALTSEKANYQAINVGTGTPVSVGSVARLIAKELGSDIQPEIVGQYRAGDIRHCVADIAKARELLAYEPTVRFEDGVPQLVEWVRTQTPDDRFEQARTELNARKLVR